ncbi:MAG: ribosomal protein methyltransferase [Bacteroidota bacterium]|jgi:ribosomal protein L11 methyltransferase
MTHIYTISYPPTIDKEEFAGLFAVIDMDGIEEKEENIDVYLNESQVQEGEEYIAEICKIYDVSFLKSELENKNWNEQWERSFQPILIDDFVHVRATFHPANIQVQHEIIIEPKMSFGTGHHPTTSQMMQNMRLLDFKEKNVLDCGSGTGILAILAEKLGAKTCIALDNDEWCYHNCIENIALNQINNVKAEIGGIENIQGRTFDIILANIHRNFLLENMSSLSNALSDKGYLIVSGFYAADAKLILDKALEHKLIATYCTNMHDWNCIILQK